MDPPPKLSGPRETYDLSQSTPIIWKDQVIVHHRSELITPDLNEGSTKWKMEMVTSGNATPIIINDILYVNGWYNLGGPTQFDSIPDFNIMAAKYDANHDNLINTLTEIPYEIAAGKRPDLGLPIGDSLSSISRFARAWDSNKDGDLDEKEWIQMKKDFFSYYGSWGNCT